MDTRKHLENLNEIKQIMERSTRFLSLSGLSGIVAGLSALIGAILAFVVLNKNSHIKGLQYFDSAVIMDLQLHVFYQLLSIGIVVLLVALFFGFYFTNRKAKRDGQTVWSKASKELMINMFVPLATGGVFSLLLIHHHLYGLVAPVTLIFYGLACVNASHVTHNEIRNLGYFNIILGLINVYFIGYGLLFWAMGFGVMHIIYGTVMYFKYEK